jgi:hypothetical protein
VGDDRSERGLPSAAPAICATIRLAICLPVGLPIHLSIGLPILLPIRLAIELPILLPIGLAVGLPVRPAIFLPRRIGHLREQRSPGHEGKGQGHGGGQHTWLHGILLLVVVERFLLMTDCEEALLQMRRAAMEKVNRG